MNSKAVAFAQWAWNRVPRTLPAQVRNRVSKGILLSGLLWFTGAGIESARGAVRYVSASAPGPTYNGTSWASAYTNVQTALAAALAGDEIWVAAGVYRPTATTNRTVSFVLKNGVALYGGFLGGETLRAQRNPDPRANGTLLSGDIGTSGDLTDNSWHVLWASNVASATVLDGFTIMHGNASGSFPDDRGGAIWLKGSSPMLRNLQVVQNSAVVAGGIAIQDSGSPAIVDCTFHGNVSGNSGGAIYCVSATSPALTNVLISGNESFGDGGAFFAASFAVPRLINVTIAGNRGGGLTAVTVGPVLQNSIVWNNTAQDGTLLQIDGPLDPASSPNLIDDGTPASNPRFVRNPDPGDGDWRTPADNDYGDLRLQTNSPAIDLGQNAANAAPFDLDGNLRIRGAAIDLGAFEFQTPSIWHVDQAVVGGLANGSTWADALTNLQAALGAALPGDEIWVAWGVYKPTNTTARAASFRLKDGVAMYGGFPTGGGNGTFAARNPNPSSTGTILSGDIDNNDTNTDGNQVAEVTTHIQGNNSYHILKSESAVSSNTIVDGFLLTAGNANGTGADSGGGALRNVNGSRPTLRNLRFEGNAGDSGAAIYNAGSDPVLEDILFVNNRTTGATGGGGGMRNVTNAHPVLSRVTFISNIAYRGGGLHNAENCNPILTDVDFIANSGINMGGGLYNENSTPQLNRVTFYGNVGNFGAGAANLASAPLFVNALFHDNSAFQRGGAIYNVSSHPQFVNCTFSENNAGTSGGAIENLTPSAPVVQNSILWGNTRGDNTPSQIEGSTAGAASRHNLIQGGYDPLTNSVVATADPLFADPAADDFRLKTNSLAIGAGTNSLVPAGITTDLDGNARLVPLAVDLGAYEAAQLGYVFPTALSVAAVPFGNPTILAGWVPPSPDLTFQFELVSTTGTLAFDTLPGVGTDGSLSFQLHPGTTGTAVLRVIISGLINGVPNQSVPYPFTLQVKNEVYPRVAFDYQAREPGPQTAPPVTGKARIRGYFQPAGQRKGIAIFPSPFNPLLASFTSYAASLEIDSGNGQRPAQGGPLSSYPLIAFNQGFDVYTVEWNDARTFLQANAMVVVDMLADLAGPGLQIDPTNNPSRIDRVLPGEKVALLGASMGGLIARFALCYLDTQAIPYQCDLFLSMDSPQEGAYIPVGLQHVAVYLDALPDDYTAGFDTSMLTSVLNAINQPSPRQMLLLHHSRAGIATPPYHAAERTAFLALLNTNGNWPTKTNLRLAAIASGRGDGLFEERGGTGAFTWPKPGGDYRILNWNTSKQVHNSTTPIVFFGCYNGSLQVEVTGYVSIAAWALSRTYTTGAAAVFAADAYATMTVTGRDTNVFGDFLHSDTTIIDTSGTMEEIKIRLRTFIRTAAALNGPVCDVIGVSQRIEDALDNATNKIAEIRDMNQTASAYSTQLWDWLPGGYTDKGRAAAESLGAAGTVSKVSDFQCFIPTVSALALSDFVAPAGVAIPANAAELSPFHALYHFGAHANTGHVDDFDGWLGQIVVHELRLLGGEVKLDIKPAPLTVSWRGMYELQASDDPGGPWSPLLRAEDGVHVPSPLLSPRRFFRLRFSEVYP